MQKVQEEKRKYYNKKQKRAHQYQENDLVAIKRTQFSMRAKFKPVFIGRYCIIKVKDRNPYNVERVGHDDSQYKISASADNMKPWYVYDSFVSEDDLIGEGFNEENIHQEHPMRRKAFEDFE